MRTTENVSGKKYEDVFRQMNRLLRFNRRIMLGSLLAAVLLVLAAFRIIGNEWLRKAMLFSSLTLLAAVTWIYFRAYLNLKRETSFYARTMNIDQEKIESTARIFLDAVWHGCGHPFFLFFMTGMSLSLAVCSGLQDQYENHFFQRLSMEVTGGKGGIPEDSVFIRALHVCHNTLAPRSTAFTTIDRPSWIDTYIYPLSTDLITAGGACGSYSVVLCRTLQELKYPVRLAQMYDGNGQPCHVLLEARASYGWVVLDPLYDLYFVKPDGRLASFADISANWQIYSPQLPGQYDRRYCYKDVRYTNWGKIPILLPAVRSLLGLFMDNDRLRQISLRTCFLRKYRMIEYSALASLAFFSSLLILKLRRRRNFKPFTPLHSRNTSVITINFGQS